jgi:hypothetical protein
VPTIALERGAVQARDANHEATRFDEDGVHGPGIAG